MITKLKNMKTTLYTDGYDMECFKKACDNLKIKVIELTETKAELEYEYDFNLFYLGSQFRLFEQQKELFKQIEKL